MPKWSKGDRITDPMVALALIVGGQVVFWNHKPQNAAWIRSMQLQTIITAVRSGAIYYARERESHERTR